MIRYVLALLVIFGFMVFLTKYLLGTGMDKGLLKPNNVQIVSTGKTIYAEQCASCHGIELGGEKDWKQPKADGRMPAPPHDETGHTWHHSDQQLVEITKFGIGKLMNLRDYRTDMPVYGEILTDKEIIAVLSYIKAQWPAEVRERHDEMNEQQSEKSK